MKKSTTKKAPKTKRESRARIMYAANGAGRRRGRQLNSDRGLDALLSVQFTTAKGKRFAVLSADDWEALVEWLETLEDLQIARRAFAALKSAGGSRKRAGWLEWKQVAQDIV